MLDLEGRVAREREGIGLRIEQMPKAALDRVLFQGLLDLADLNRGKEMRKRIAVGCGSGSRARRRSRYVLLE